MTSSGMTMSTMSMGPEATMAMTTVSASAAAATASVASNMSDMDMMGGCKISMTWNWFTVGACFISKSWQITSSGMFAGSCIGVILLVIVLEALRRLQREYEAYIRSRDQRQIIQRAQATRSAHEPESSGKAADAIYAAASVSSQLSETMDSRTYRPSTGLLLQRQVIRSLLHMLQFAVAYFIMLLAMYYNGYIIICIIIGAFLGAFMFSWDQLIGNSRTGAADVTGCCG